VTEYQVTINNDSQIDDMNALLFQQKPVQPKDAYALAWFSKKCHKGTFATFGFTIDYSFVWGQTGNLGPGRNYSAGNKPVPAQLGDQITLDYDGGFQFLYQKPGAPPDSLIIMEDANVPGAGNADRGNVGIGMSGKGLFVVPTQNDSNVQFLPDPKYWIGFGMHVPGDVVEINELTAAIEIDLQGYTNIDCTYDGKNWSFKRFNQREVQENRVPARSGR
jgi:hypothetical protein